MSKELGFDFAARGALPHMEKGNNRTALCQFSMCPRAAECTPDCDVF